MRKIKKSVFVISLLFVITMFSACNLTPSQKEQMKAEGLRIAAKDITMYAMKSKPELKPDVIKICDNVIGVLQSGKIPTYQHVQMFIDMFKIKPEMKILAMDLYSLFSLYVNLSGKDPIAMISQRDMLYLLSFFAGVRQGAGL